MVQLLSLQEHQVHGLVSANQSNNKAYIGQIAPSLRQTPLQYIAAQIQFSQLQQMMSETWKGLW